MGCDIHLRVEFRAALETVALAPNGEITVVPAVDETVEWDVDGQTVVLTREARDIGVAVWQPAEQLSPNEDKNPQWYDLSDPRQKEQYDALPDFDVAYADRWYTGRDYQLFHRLVPGLRGPDEGAVFEERGIPDDASDEVAGDIEAWGCDGHSHSWQTLEELEQHDWAELLAYEWEDGNGKRHVDRNPRWMEMLDRLRELAEEKCAGDKSAVRIVYWFDN